MDLDLTLAQKLDQENCSSSYMQLSITLIQKAYENELHTQD